MYSNSQSVFFELSIKMNEIPHLLIDYHIFESSFYFGFFELIDNYREIVIVDFGIPIHFSGPDEPKCFKLIA